MSKMEVLNIEKIYLVQVRKKIGKVHKVPKVPEVGKKSSGILLHLINCFNFISVVLKNISV